MNIKEWIANNIGYRFSGCAYAKYHDKVFNPIRKLIPKEFLHKDISDLGCGDGTNSLRIKEIFQAKRIVGYELNPYLIERACAKGLKTKQMDLNQKIPVGEMAVFSMSFHHIKNKDKVSVLKKVVKNYNYIFLIEPIRDLYHALFDAGHVLKKKDWIKVFDEALGHYKLYQQGNHLIVFFKKL